MNICNSESAYSPAAPVEREQAHGAIKAENRSAFAQRSSSRWRDARHAGMGSAPVGHAEDEPQVGIWRIAGNRDRSGAGWADTVATGVQRREDRPMRRNPTAVSGVWLFLLSSVARRNGLLSLRFGGAPRKPRNGLRRLGRAREAVTNPSLSPDRLAAGSSLMSLFKRARSRIGG